MNILMVDDQPVVIEGLKKGIAWSNLEVTEVFTAYSVKQAIKIIEQEKIDVVLSDIEMPQQSGIELFRWIKDEFPTILCILLSAHAEFHYAQEALSLGVFEYVVQPASYENITKVLSRAIVEAKQKQNYLQDKNSFLLAQLFQEYLLSDEVSFESFVEQAESLKLPIELDNEYHLILVEQGKIPMIPPEKGKSIIIKDNYNLLLLPATEELSGLYSIIQLEPQKALYYIRPSKPKDWKPNFVGLRELARNNVVAQQGLITLERQNIIDSKAFPLPPVSRWKALLSHNRYEKAAKEVIIWLEEQREQEYIGKRFLTSFIDIFLELLFSAFPEAFTTKAEIITTQDFFVLSHSYEKTKDYIRYALKYAETREKLTPKNTSTIEKVIEYIEQNVERKLTRNEIAEAVYINPEYLSRLFRKEMGISLNDYVLSQKIILAQTLLENTALPVSIIASKAGYQSFSYFSQIFKKEIGVTPNEYRQQKQKT